MNVKRALSKYSNELIIFFSIYIFIVITNSSMAVLCQTTGSDEIGTIAGATYFAGLDWTYLISNTIYYGFGYSILMSPIFRITDNPIVIYKLMLSFNAFLTAIVSLLAYRIIKTKFKLNNKIGVIVAITSTTFAFNIQMCSIITNEAMLIFLTWLLVYILIQLHDNYSIKKLKIVYSTILALVVSYALIVHTRAITFWGGICIVVILYYLLYKRLLIRIDIVATVGLIGYFTSKLLIDLVQKGLWLKKPGQILMNSSESLSDGIKSALSIGVSALSIKSFLFTVSGQIFTAFVVSGGLFLIGSCLVVIIIFNSVRKHNDFTNDTYFIIIGSFALSMIIATISMQAFTWLSATTIELEKSKLSKAFFYTRYFACYCGPIVLLALVYAIKYELGIVKKVFIFSTFLFSLCAVVILLYCKQIFSVNPRISNLSGVFYSIIPFMPSSYINVFDEYGNRAFLYSDFFVFALIGLTVYSVISLFIYNKKYTLATIVVLLFSLYQNLFSSINIYSTNSTALYKSVENIYHTVKRLESENIINKNNDIYSVFESNYVFPLQFVLNRNRIIPIGCISIKDIITGSVENKLYVSQKQILLPGLPCIELDNDEYLYSTDLDLISFVGNEIGKPILFEELIEVKDINFTPDTENFIDGFNGLENGGSWTSYVSSVFLSLCHDQDNVIMVTYNNLPEYIFSEKKQYSFKFVVSDTILYEHSATYETLAAGELRFVIPKNLLNDKFYTQINIISDVWSPSEFGISEDSRNLGLMLSSIRVVE